MRKRILFRDEEISREIERRISEDRLIGVDRERHPVEYTESFVRCDKAEFSFSARI